MSSEDKISLQLILDEVDDCILNISVLLSKYDSRSVEFELCLVICLNAEITPELFISRERYGNHMNLLSFLI